MMPSVPKNYSNSILSDRLVLFFLCISIMILAGLIHVNGSILLIFVIFLMIFVLLVLKPFLALAIYIFLLPHMGVRFFGKIASNLFLPFAIGACLLSYFFTLSQSKNNCISQKEASDYGIKWSVFGFMVVILVSSLLNETRHYTDVLFFLLKIFAIFFMVAYCVKEKSDIDRVLKVLLLSGLVMALIGIVELFVGKTFIYSAWTGVQRYRLGFIRIGSTAASPTHLSFTLVSLIPIALYFSNQEMVSVRRIMYRALVCVFLFCVFFTFARAGYGMIVFIFLAVYYEKIIRVFKNSSVIKILIIGLIAVLVLLVGLFLTNSLTYVLGAEKSSHTRQLALIVSIENFFHNPFIGIGFDRIEEANALYVRSSLTRTGGISSMNYYAKLLSENGIFALLFFVLIIFEAYLLIRKQVLTKPTYKYLALSYLVVVLNMAVIDIYGILFVIVAIILCIRKQRIC